MNNLGIENARSTIFECEEIISKKQSEVNKLLNSNTINKIEYQKFCEYLMSNNEKVGSLNFEQIALNAGILFKSNYEIVKKVKEPEIILDFLLLIGDKDCNIISNSANYLLDTKIIKKLNTISAMKNFENFKERLITTIIFRAKYLQQEIDVMKLINDFLKYYKENITEFYDDNSKGYYRAKA